MITAAMARTISENWGIANFIHMRCFIQSNMILPPFVIRSDDPPEWLRECPIISPACGIEMSGI
jgi:hypothetical protein